MQFPLFHHGTDVFIDIFDGVFDGDDMARTGLVDAVQQTGERG